MLYCSDFICFRGCKGRRYEINVLLHPVPDGSDRKEVPDSLYTSLGEEQVVLLLGIAKERESLFQEEVEEIILRIRENISFSIAEKLFAMAAIG